MKKFTEKTSSYKEEKEHNTMTTYVSIPESIINSVIDPMVDENDKTRMEAFLKGLKVDPSMFPVAAEAEKTKKTKKTKKAEKAEEATKTKKGKKADPKKALNTYNLFMKAFMQVHKDEYDDNKERFKAMTSAWSSTKDDKDARDALLEKYNVVQAVKKDEE